MRAYFHHALQWMHDETVTAGRWCHMHMLHDAHFWFYLLLAVSLAAFFAILLNAGGISVPNYDIPYYGYPYGAL